jgi:hypothetical protein
MHTNKFNLMKPTCTSVKFACGKTLVLPCLLGQINRPRTDEKAPKFLKNIVMSQHWDKNSTTMSS